MLWIYSQNDKYFWPELAQQFAEAFRSGGGHAEFILAPPIGSDGNVLFRNIPIWSNSVDDFLKANHLVFLSEVLPEPAPPNVLPPPGLGPLGLKAFNDYLLAGPCATNLIIGTF
jgi:hypothetical protein